MSEFTKKEQDLIKSLGVELFKFLLNLWKTKNAKGEDLTKLLEKASEMNSKTIDDL